MRPLAAPPTVVDFFTGDGEAAHISTYIQNQCSFWFCFIFGHSCLAQRRELFNYLWWNEGPRDWLGLADIRKLEVALGTCRSRSTFQPKLLNTYAPHVTRTINIIWNWDRSMWTGSNIMIVMCCSYLCLHSCKCLNTRASPINPITYRTKLLSRNFQMYQKYPKS